MASSRFVLELCVKVGVTMAELEAVRDLCLKLCNVEGTPGDESPAMKLAAEELGFCEDIKCDPICGVSAFLGDKNAKRQIMFDAHIDQIALIVTEIDEDGFLHLSNLGGIDRRTMPGSLVKVFGKKVLSGVVCCLPPHISGGKDKIAEVQQQAVDLGLDRQRVCDLVSPGDRVLLAGSVRPLMGSRVAGPALDDRGGCAAVIRAAQLLKGKKLGCGVHFVLSTREEVGGQGAQIQAYRLKPTEAVAVDVSFAKQAGVDQKGLGSLSMGPMIGFAASLSKDISSCLIELAKENNIPYQLEAMGGRTGTNCDSIGTVGVGIPCGLLSIPQRNMHTPSEVCDLEDIENTAALLAAYVMSICEEA